MSEEHEFIPLMRKYCLVQWAIYNLSPTAITAIYVHKLKGVLMGRSELVSQQPEPPLTTTTKTKDK